MGTLKIRKQTDGGMNYMANVLDYTVRGHGYEDRAYSPNVDIYDCFNQFYKVKEYFGKTSGNPVYHFIVTYNSGIIKEDNSRKLAWSVRILLHILQTGIKLSMVYIRRLSCIKTENLFHTIMRIL